MRKTYTLLFLFIFTFTFAFAQVAGTWKIAPQAQALAVGPALGDYSWWSNSAADVTLRSCFFDDEYVFNEDGTFQNVQQNDTWVEPWQGISVESCATPVAPHDGSNAATWTYDAGAGTITLNGVGAYLGLAKVFNGGECASPDDAPASIVYPVVFSENGTVMTIDIEIQDGAYWHFVLTTNAGDPPPPEEFLTLPVTFEDADVNYGLTDFGGNSSEIVVDPTDESNHVAKTIKTVAAETWAGTTLGGTVGFSAPLPFSDGSTTMSVRVWSPTAGTPIRLKVEDADDDEVTCETEAITTAAETWETLEFDFSNEAPGTATLNYASSYNKASIFFNFGTTGADAGEQTYYWDDVVFIGAAEPKPYLAEDVQDNFENDGWGTISDWGFQDSPDLTGLLVVTDPTNPGNHIAAYVRPGTFEWTNAQFTLGHRMDLTVRNKFEITVALPSTNDYSGDLTPTVSLKLQNSLLGADAWTTQTEVKLTVDEFDKWVKLTFDFSGAADRKDYDKLVIQFGGEGHFVPGNFSFDDLWLVDNSSINESSLTQTNVYPNPVSDVLYIENAENLINISIYSVQGQLIYESNESVRSIKVNDFPTGMYTLKADGVDGKQYFAKFIIK